MNRYFVVVSLMIFAIILFLAVMSWMLFIHPIR